MEDRIALLNAVMLSKDSVGIIIDDMVEMIEAGESLSPALMEVVVLLMKSQTKALELLALIIADQDELING